MVLKGLMIEEINKNYGIKKIINRLEFLLETIPFHEKTSFENIIIYIGNLYTTNLDPEYFNNYFPALISKAIVILTKLQKKYNCNILGFLVELLTFQKNYSKQIKRIA